MRQRAVVRGGDDRREGDVLGADLLRPPFEPPDDRGLGVPGEPVRLDQPAVEVVGDRRSASDRVQLLLVLDGAQSLHQSAGRHQLDLVGQQARELRVARHRHGRVLEPEAKRPAGSLFQQLGDIAQQVLPALQRLVAGDLRLGALEVAKVGHEGALIGADQTEAVGAREAAQVADVDQVGDQQQVDPLLFQQRAELLRPALERGHAAEGGSTPSLSAISSSASR